RHRGPFALGDHRPSGRRPLRRCHQPRGRHACPDHHFRDRAGCTGRYAPPSRCAARRRRQRRLPHAPACPGGSGRIGGACAGRRSGCVTRADGYCPGTATGCGPDHLPHRPGVADQYFQAWRTGRFGHRAGAVDAGEPGTAGGRRRTWCRLHLRRRRARCAGDARTSPDARRDADRRPPRGRRVPRAGGDPGPGRRPGGAAAVAHWHRAARRLATPTRGPLAQMTPPNETTSQTPSSPTGPIRVALVDDQQLVRAGFALVINSQPDMEVVLEAGDGAQALRLLTSYEVDVVLMDVRMPAMDGLAATAQLTDPATRHVGPTPRVVILTTFDLDEYVLQAIKAG